jgi:mannose-6-phosphate isomerase-like protein (cupin superfamily)
VQLIERLIPGEEPVPVHRDSRGVAAFYSKFTVENLHVVSLNPDAVRGNHSHDQDEIICVLGGGGLCEISVENESSGGKETVLIQNNMESYWIKAGLKHTLRNVGNNVFYLVCFLTGEERSGGSAFSRKWGEVSSDKR